MKKHALLEKEEMTKRKLIINEEQNILTVAEIMEDEEMKPLKLLVISLLAVCCSVSTTAFAVTDSNASVVQLRQSCTEAGVALNNCFTDLATLTYWIFNQRNPAPSAASPVLVEIGPGQFDGSFICSDSGYVTLSGAGMQNTIINASSYPVAMTNCINMTFRGMTIKASGLGVQGGGSVTFWHDVEVDVGGFYAWLDGTGNNTCYTTTPGKHYWFSSRIIGRGTINSSTTYQSACDESWFFGSEITKVASGNPGNEFAVKSTKKRGQTHIYGGSVRVIAQGTASSTTLIPISTENAGIVHIHGTGIDAIGTGPNPVIALSATTSGEIHANETSYNLSTGAGGSIKRVSKDATGHVHAPYLWEAHTNVPYASSGIPFDSVTGFDMAVVTANSAGVQDHPHVVIFDSTCPGKWFDSTINQCR
jgi:hypothetical protein